MGRTSPQGCEENMKPTEESRYWRGVALLLTLVVAVTLMAVRR